MKNKLVGLLNDCKWRENGAKFFYDECRKLGVHRVIANSTASDMIAWKENNKWEWLIAPTFSMGQMISGKGSLAFGKLPSIQYNQLS